VKLCAFLLQAQYQWYQGNGGLIANNSLIFSLAGLAVVGLTKLDRDITTDFLELTLIAVSRFFFGKVGGGAPNLDMTGAALWGRRLAIRVFLFRNKGVQLT
jgi:hypothetical protein